ncbi:hypothetical protein ACJX0J_007620, partial [Zea mays]
RSSHRTVRWSSLRVPPGTSHWAACTFCTQRVSFLGYVVTPQGIEVDSSKIAAIR